MANHELVIETDVVRKRYLRTDRDQAQREWSTLAWLAEQAPGLAPRPLDRDVPAATVVMSRIPGEPIECTFTTQQMTAMIDSYRELYAVPVPADMPFRFFHPEQFMANLTGWLAEAPRDGLSEPVRRALAEAEDWNAALRPQLREILDPVVAQADGNVHNMLWDGDRVRLIDFEYAGVGDLAFEVADLVEHVSSRLRGLLEPDRLLAGFELSAAQRRRVEDFRIVLATFWLLMLLPGSPGHARNPRGSAERQAEHLLALLLA